MPTIMIPLRLWKRFGLPGAPTEIPDDGASKLGPWSVAELSTAAGELAMFVNARTHMVIVAPMGGFADLLPAFVARLRDELERRGVAARVVAEEMQALSAIALGKNTDRALISKMNDLVYQAGSHAYDTSPARACDRLQEVLNQVVSRGRAAAATAPAEPPSQLFVTLH
jgi:hypothetical protein